MFHGKRCVGQGHEEGGGMKINWLTGPHNWAYKNLASHVMKALPQHKHVSNDSAGDITVLMSVDQLRDHATNETTILHIDGNRWYERCIKQ